MIYKREPVITDTNRPWWQCTVMVREGEVVRRGGGGGGSGSWGEEGSLSAGAAQKILGRR